MFIQVLNCVPEDLKPFGGIWGLPCSGEAIANLSDIKKPVSVETGAFYIKAWQ